MVVTGSKSRKPSGANSKPPDTPILFLDRALGNKIVAEALRKSGAEVRVHSDHFPSDAEDRVWLPEVGRRDWILLTKDAKIRYHTIEREALVNAGIRAFILVAGSISGPEMAKSFVRAIPAIRRFILKYKPPFIAKVYRDGRVILWYSPGK